jgi:hypothetical protein
MVEFGELPGRPDDWWVSRHGIWKSQAVVKEMGASRSIGSMVRRCVDGMVSVLGVLVSLTVDDGMGRA